MKPHGVNIGEYNTGHRDILSALANNPRSAGFPPDATHVTLETLEQEVDKCIECLSHTGGQQPEGFGHIQYAFTSDHLKTLYDSLHAIRELVRKHVKEEEVLVGGHKQHKRVSTVVSRH